ncbi:hypothetical protein ACJX0J_025366, partial [Zea mays]
CALVECFLHVFSFLRHQNIVYFYRYLFLSGKLKNKISMLVAQLYEGKTT